MQQDYRMKKIVLNVSLITLVLKQVFIKCNKIKGVKKVINVGMGLQQLRCWIPKLMKVFMEVVIFQQKLSTNYARRVNIVHQALLTQKLNS